MCGIAGIYAYGREARASRDELLRINDRMAARGPDGAGEWFSPQGQVGFAHRRLAIIDLSPDGLQPMQSINAPLHIVFNGEIYNYRALRDELESTGVAFRSHSDTEVLMELYAREGPAMCARLRGMFSLAIWDERKQELFLARDPFGIKPLYLQDDGAILRFASQVKALLAGGGIPNVPEPAGVVGYWIWGHVPEPWTTIRGISSLPAGTWLVVDREGRRKEGAFPTFASIVSSASSSIDIEREEALRSAVIDSVRHHLVADVPVGVFLSSGIDSAVLAGVASESGYDLRTVTLGFEEYRGTPHDETPLAAEVARLFGTRHETVWLGRGDFEAALPDFLESMDQPSTDGLNTWLVSRAAATLGLKVAISGLGGDELFGGYPSFRDVPRLHRIAKATRGLAAFGRNFRRASVPILRRFTSEKFAGVFEYGGTWEGAYLLRRAQRMPWDLEIDALEPEFVTAGLARLDLASLHGTPDFASVPCPRAMVSMLEVTRYMRDRLLRDSDWAGMAHSIEIRVPFVDLDLATCVAERFGSVSPYTKGDLARVTRPELPRAVTGRPKTGFTVPVRDWMMQADPAMASQRGLRSWQRTVASAFTQ